MEAHQKMRPWQACRFCQCGWAEPAGQAAQRVVWSAKALTFSACTLHSLHALADCSHMNLALILTKNYGIDQTRLVGCCGSRSTSHVQHSCTTKSDSKRWAGPYSDASGADAARWYCVHRASALVSRRLQRHVITHLVRFFDFQFTPPGRPRRQNGTGLLEDSLPQFCCRTW